MHDLNPEQQNNTLPIQNSNKKPMSTGKIVLIVLAAICCCGGIPVVGIVAAIAIPAYNDYTIRSKMADIQAALKTEKTNLETQFNNAKNCDINPSVSNKNIESVSFSPIQTTETIEGCQITTTFNPKTMSAVKNARLIYTLLANNDGTTEWDCHITASPNQFKYFPANCRNEADERMLENHENTPPQ